jgi:hypothetical protein
MCVYIYIFCTEKYVVKSEVQVFCVDKHSGVKCMGVRVITMRSSPLQ